MRRPRAGHVRTIAVVPALAAGSPRSSLETPPGCLRGSHGSGEGVLEHEAICDGEGLDRAARRPDVTPARRPGAPRGARPPPHGMERIRHRPTVEANGNKPISFLSVAAEPHCASVDELQSGRRSSRFPDLPPLRCSPSCFCAGRVAPSAGTDAPSEPAKSPTTGGLEGPVYTLKNELSIRRDGRSTPPRPGPPERQSRPRKPFPPAPCVPGARCQLPGRRLASTRP